MKRFSLKLFLAGLAITSFMLISPLKANAVLQSNGGTPATKNIDGWMLSIRQMESQGGTLGLNETVNSSGLLSATSNGLDCHMQKNTEYGAMILLSASSYGNSKPITNSATDFANTTTGNATGVVMPITSEWVAAGTNLSLTTTFRGADGRYKNINYRTTADAVYYKGDAMAQGKWHNTNASYSPTWFNDTYGSGLLRSHSDSVFSYYAYCDRRYSSGAAWYEKKWASRAVIVVGQDL